MPLGRENRSEEHTSELQSRRDLVCRLLLEKKKAYLEGTYSEIYPNISLDEEGMKRLFTQFSFPGGIPSHVAPETPVSIHEGGELGYALSHAYGADVDNNDLILDCVVGDGEAENGPLATSWHYNKFLDPATDGVVLPILHFFF